MSEAATEQTNGAAQQPVADNRENLMEAWRRAERTAEAQERAEGRAPEPEPAPEPEQKAEPAEQEPAEAKPDKPKKAKAEAKEEQLEAEDKNEGKVSVEERRKFRQQKREAFEKIETERAELKRQVDAANRYYEPAMKAMKLAQDGDYDGAIRALGLEGGLSEANKRHLKKEKGEDPRVEKLMREQEELRRAIAEREEADRRAQETAAASKQRQQWIADQAAELETHEEYGVVAKNGWYLEGIYAVQDKHWDGRETLSAEEAAREYRESVETDPRAKEVYQALAWIFGNQDAANPEGSKPAVRGSPNPARPGGKAPPKSFSQRSAAEARAPDRIKDDDPQRDIKLRDKFSILLEQSSD